MPDKPVMAAGPQIRVGQVVTQHQVHMPGMPAITISGQVSRNIMRLHVARCGVGPAFKPGPLSCTPQRSAFLHLTMSHVSTPMLQARIVLWTRASIAPALPICAEICINVSSRNTGLI